MRVLLLLISVMVSFTLAAQSFPQSWVGKWKGELLWYQGNQPEPKKIQMEMNIQPGDTAQQYTWQIIYGKASEDNRPYTLIAKDTAKGHWAIDEHNGIVLDQYLVAGKFCGAFTVQNSTIINNYWLQDDNLHVEFYNVSAKPVATTGKGNEDSPFVNSYQVKTYQKAILQRSK